MAVIANPSPACSPFTVLAGRGFLLSHQAAHGGVSKVLSLRVTFGLLFVLTTVPVLRSRLVHTCLHFSAGSRIVILK